MARVQGYRRHGAVLFECVTCGQVCTKAGMRPHEQTQKHQSALKTQNQPSVFPQDREPETQPTAAARLVSVQVLDAITEYLKEQDDADATGLLLLLDREAKRGQLEPGAVVLHIRSKNEPRRRFSDSYKVVVNSDSILDAVAIADTIQRGTPTNPEQHQGDTITRLEEQCSTT